MWNKPLLSVCGQLFLDWAFPRQSVGGCFRTRPRMESACFVVCSLYWRLFKHHLF